MSYNHFNNYMGKGKDGHIYALFKSATFYAGKPEMSRFYSLACGTGMNIPTMK